MLRVVSDLQLMESMKLAQETKTEDQLIKWLLWLDEWHGKDTTIVELHADLPMSPGSIAWCAYHAKDGKKTHPDAQPFYNGGLIFHRSAGEWSVHS